MSRRLTRAWPAVAATLLAAPVLPAQNLGPATAVLRLFRDFDQTTTTIRVNYADGSAVGRSSTTRPAACCANGGCRGGRKARRRSSAERSRSSTAILASRLFSPGGAQTEGGFIVDGPAGSAATDRNIQIRLLSADRRTLLRVVIVDLSTATIASARAWFE